MVKNQMQKNDFFDELAKKEQKLKDAVKRLNNVATKVFNFENLRGMKNAKCEIKFVPKNPKNKG